MEYDIIEEVGELATSEAALDEKLAKAARLMASYLHFDECLVYLAADGPLRLVAASSPIACGQAEYGMEEGLPWLAFRQGGFVEASNPSGGTLWKGVHDSSLAGCRSALVCPLGRLGDSRRGALYFRSRGRVRLTLLKRQMARLACMQLAFLLRSSGLQQDHHRVYAELLEMQQKLVDSEKLLALGDMAATMAHEIRNPLLSIGGYASRLRRQLPPGSPGIGYIEQMSAEIGRIEKIMNGIIRFLRDNVVEFRPDDLDEIIDEALGLFSDELSAHRIMVERRKEAAARLEVLADREQMKIAFDNLIANAIQSMEGGGTLCVATSYSGGFAVARVSDTGGGIDPKHIGYIFNPFFTTKKHGTGLGLPIANSIIMRHKGVIEVDNYGLGAAFTIKLPHAGRCEGAPPGQLAARGRAL